jgi:hydroxyacylglutathione hydrolase
MATSSMIIKQVELGPMMNFIYLIGCSATGDAAIIDPAWDVRAILKAAQDTNLTIRKILVTHAHPDHINALEQLLKATQAQVVIHSDELAFFAAIGKGFGMSTDFLSEYQDKICRVLDGDIFQLGNLSIQCIHTPGHTPGSLCFLTEGCLFAGDTLFVDACGRVDIPGGDARLMWRS